MQINVFNDERISFMKNIDKWRSTKFVFKNNCWISSSDPKEVNRGSRFIANILARHYSKCLKTYATGHILDLGCGKVPLYSMYKDYVNSVTCVDWSNSKHGNMYTDYNVDLNAKIELPFKERSFETVLCTDVLEHIASPEYLMKEIYRILANDGKIILGVPFFYWIHESPYDFNRYTEYMLRRFCKDVGLEIIELFSYGGAPEVVFDIISKLMRNNRLASRIFYRLSRICMRTKTIDKMSKNTARIFPLGYIVVAKK